MSGLVHRVVKWLPPTWQTAIERESRDWRVRCPKCLHETSVWDLGGVRYKAAGNCVRSVRCLHCRTKFLGQLYRVGSGNEQPRINAATENYAAAAIAAPTPVKAGFGIANGTAPVSLNATTASDCRLWIDGAGCYLLLTSDAVTIGSPASGSDRPDVAIMSAISRRQVQIVRTGEGFSLVPVGNHAFSDGRLLRAGETFEIGGGVELRLRVPNPLSHTAVLDIVSSHRTEPRFNGVILLDQVCVLGPGADAHIRSPLWPTPLILFRRDDALWCKAVPGLQRNGQPVSGEAPLDNGDVLTTEDLRLRVELSCG
ncbi:MAG TPA: hypothetical protein VM452_17110 [Caulifigura sp.]|nr:hypothetical protein [Caulifigura sp.]